MIDKIALYGETGRTEFVDVAGGRIAFEVIGDGPLVVLSPGISDTRSTYRFLAPLIANAGYRVASVDLRGPGESSTSWHSYSRTDTAGDLIEVIRKLGGRRRSLASRSRVEMQQSRLRRTLSWWASLWRSPRPPEQ